MPMKLCYGHRLETYNNITKERKVRYYTYSPHVYPFNTVEISGDGGRDLEWEIHRIYDNKKGVKIKLYSYVNGKWEEDDWFDIYIRGRYDD